MAVTSAFTGREQRVATQGAGDINEGRLEGLRRELGYAERRGREDLVAQIKAEIRRLGGQMKEPDPEPEPEPQGELESTALEGAPETTDVKPPVPRRRTARRRAGR